MNSSPVKLPKNKKSLAQLLRRHGDRCEQMYMYRRTNWLLCWYYLNGYRRFDVYDPSTGKLTPHILDQEGNMEFQSQQLLFDINQVAGRIQSMDLRPRILTQGFTLPGQRSSAVSQIICDSVYSDDEIRRSAEQWAFLFTCLGCAGLQSNIEDHPTIGLTADLEVIHPKELFPFPATAQDATKAFGLVRQRYVSMSRLTDLHGSKIKANADSLDWWEVDPGEPWADQPINSGLVGGTSMIYPSGPAKPESSEDESIGVVKVRQLWLMGPRGTVSRYIEASGDYIITDVSLDDVEVYCPIGVARFMNNGSWHGAGMFDLMFSQHRMFEKLSKSLYTNIMDIDRYGVLVLPQGQFNQNSVLRDVGRGLRAMFWDPDPVAQSFSPFAIQPQSSGEMPGRVAQFAKEGLSSVNPIQDLIKEKGRVDSASGLQFLDEQITRALTCPTLGVQSAWGAAYRSGCQQALSALTTSPRPLPVHNLTLDLAGAVVNYEDGTITFSDNPVPDISRLSFTVRDISPRSRVARKQEALDLFQRGISTDPLDFRLFCLKEDLDPAIWMEGDRASYEMAVRTILTLFSDGSNPGRIILTPHTTRPEILLRLLSAFMSGPIMISASPEVVDAFRDLRLYAMQLAGGVLPEGIPNPDDSAHQSAMLSQSAGPSGQLRGLSAAPSQQVHS